MGRYYRKLALLGKIEATYGTDAVPTGVANAIQANNVTLTPLEATEVSRDLMLPYLGQQGVELANQYVRMQYQVELAGSGTAGTAPAFGPLLRACGLAETVTAGVSVSYSPVSGNYEALSTYWNADGVRHIALGMRGNVSAELTPAKIPYLKFDLIGLLGTVSDQALPAVTLTGFKRPKIVNKANTTLSLFGSAQRAESFTADFGQKAEFRGLIGYEGIEISDRSATGTVVVEARSVAADDWMGRATARTRGVLQLVHGTTAGNIVTIDAPAVEIGKPTQGQTQGILNYSLPLMFCTDAGNDELTFTFT